MNYHAHIYWNNEIEKEVALGLRLTLLEFGCSLGRVRDTPVGPHRFPMYQASYDDGNRVAVEGFLRKNTRSISILLHEDVGKNHLRDHTEGARWLGKELPLDLEFLRDLDSSES